MGQVKRLWQDKIEQAHQDFMDGEIDFNEAYSRLRILEYTPDHATDSLELCQQERNLRCPM